MEQDRQQMHPMAFKDKAHWVAEIDILPEAPDGKDDSDSDDKGLSGE